LQCIDLFQGGLHYILHKIGAASIDELHELYFGMAGGEQVTGDERGSGNFQVFKPDDSPTVVDLITEAKGNVIELVAILQSLLLNSQDVLRLKTDLNLASISLPDIVRSIRRLNQFHPRKYPIDENQLQKLVDCDQ
jgi:hypothetical protein